MLLLNTDRDEPFEVATGDRIAQLVVTEVASIEFVAADALAETARADGGFGSTGE